MNQFAAVAASTPTPDVVIGGNPRRWAALGTVAGVVTLGYLWRALIHASLVDWAMAGLLLVITGASAWAMLEARTPLLVADPIGVRLRRGRTWHGLPWSAVEGVRVRPATPWREGSLTLTPTDGAVVGVPLPFATAAASRELVGDLDEVAGFTVPVVRELSTNADLLELVRSLLFHMRRGVAVAVCRLGTPGRTVDPAPAEAPEASEPEVIATSPAVPATRGPRPASRVDVALPTAVAAQLISGSHTESHTATPPAARSGTVSPSAATVARTVPVVAPVIGPVLALAREQLGLSIDTVAERTSIRAHLVEAIERDDFSGCGGDFYARGHLKALCRCLHIDPAGVLRDYDRVYAGAPIGAARVLRADSLSQPRGSVGRLGIAPRWGRLAAVTLACAVVWGVAVTLNPPSTSVVVPSPSIQGSLAADSAPITSPQTTTHRVRLTAVAAPVVVDAQGQPVPQASVRVVVRDRLHQIVFQGRLRPGHHRVLIAVAPFTVRVSDGPAVRVRFDGVERGTVGTVPGPATRVFE